MIVTGLGFRRGIEAQEIVTIVTQALERAALPPAALDGLATAEPLADMAAFVSAADRLSVRTIAVARADLEGAADRVRTRSARALAAYGVGSVAEAAALAAAGPGAMLLLERITSPRATCALAQGADAGEQASPDATQAADAGGRESES